MHFLYVTIFAIPGYCDEIPVSAAKCVQLLVDAYSPYYSHAFYPNSVNDFSADFAKATFDSLDFTDCHANAELFFCAQLFPDCPAKRWVRKPCRQLCQAVQDACQSAYNAAFPSDPWPWDCNDFHDTGAADELCLHPEGGKFLLLLC